MDLEEATVEELVDELHRRFSYGLLVAGIAPSKNNPDLEDFGVFRRGGVTLAVGIAERCRDLIEREINEPQGYDEG